MTRRRALIALLTVAVLSAASIVCIASVGSSAGLVPTEHEARATVASAPSIAPPSSPVKLIFVHHSTGQAWLADDYGGLGVALRSNNYYVSDTNYGWGPNVPGSDPIGSYTDIGQWWLWFRSPNSPAYLSALYGESGQHCDYSRLSNAPAGDNQIIMLKSCFPNSALKGTPSDPIPPIESNPLRGEGAGSEYHTVANAKGIYIDLLEYFRTRPDKLFIIVTAPPLSDSGDAANARALNQWLVTDWLNGYPYKNVYVFDYYNVLTTNGGSPSVNDLYSETGNHHRWWNNAVQHTFDGMHNTLAYPTDDDHPSAAGDVKATNEFLPLLNKAYNEWSQTPPLTPWQSLGGYLISSPAATSPSSGVVDVFVRGTDNALWWRHWSGQDWSAWNSLGGYLTADPAATSQVNGIIDVFVRGSDGALWQREYSSGVWGAWTPLGGVLAPGTGPAACSWGPGRLDVFVKGTDGALWHQGYNGAWSGWEPLGGYLTSSPAATSPASGVIDVFVRGSTGALWQKEYNNGWHDWTSLGGYLAPGTGPAACSWGAGRLDVSVVGTDGPLWHQSFDGHWSGWQSLGGYLTASPAATSPTSGAIDVFVRGSTGELWWMTYYD